MAPRAPHATVTRVRAGWGGVGCGRRRGVAWRGVVWHVTPHHGSMCCCTPCCCAPLTCSSQPPGADVISREAWPALSPASCSCLKVWPSRDITALASAEAKLKPNMLCCCCCGCCCGKGCTAPGCPVCCCLCCQGCGCEMAKSAASPCAHMHDIAEHTTCKQRKRW